MKKVIFGLAFVILLLFSSCNLLSLYPLYTKEVLVRKDEIDGIWMMPIDSTYFEWAFEAPTLSSSYDYALSVTDPDDEEEEQYEIHIVQLGEDYYFDIFPKADRYMLLTSLMACHTFGKVEFQNNKMIYYTFDADWLKSLFDKRKIRLRHERTGKDEILLTASPKELQQFLIKYGQDENAYLDTIVLTRPL